MTLHQYVPVKVVAAFTTPLGTVDITGMMREQEFITAARVTATWSIEGDGNGNATRVKNSNKVGDLSITVSASDPVNDRLSKLAITDEQTEAVVGILKVRDLSGTSEIVMRGAFIETVPPPSFAGTRGVRVWRWLAAKQDSFVGGHGTP